MSDDPHRASHPFGHLLLSDRVSEPDISRRIGKGRIIATLTRVRLPGKPPYFTMPATTKRGNGRLEYVNPEHVPPDEVAADWDRAVFELERVAAVPWAFWRVVRRVE